VNFSPSTSTRLGLEGHDLDVTLLGLHSRPVFGAAPPVGVGREPIARDTPVSADEFGRSSWLRLTRGS
jgi:hypothetical protein